MAAIRPATWLEPHHVDAARSCPLGWGVVTSKHDARSTAKWRPYRHCEILDRRFRRLADPSDALNRLIVVHPRQHGKTQLSSVIFPTWYLGHNPHHQIGVGSYGADRAVKIGAFSRALFHRFAGPVFGLSVDPTSSAKKEWQVADHDGGMIACGIDGRFNGERLDGLILDDLFKDARQALSPKYRQDVWDWFTSVALPCVPPWGWILVVNTRWSPDDLIGRMLATERDYAISGHPIHATAIASAADLAA